MHLTFKNVLIHLDLFVTLGVTNALLSIPTQQTTELTPQ